MRKIIQRTMGVFERNAIENALKLGIRNLLIFGEIIEMQEYKNITLFVSKSYEDFRKELKEKGIALSEKEALVCSLLHKSFSKTDFISLLRQLRTFPEGTTLVFTHSEEVLETERLLSSFGFRTVEHFNIDRAAEAAVKAIEKDLTENTYFCLAARK